MSFALDDAIYDAQRQAEQDGYEEGEHDGRVSVLEELIDELKSMIDFGDVSEGEPAYDLYEMMQKMLKKENRR